MVENNTTKTATTNVKSTSSLPQPGPQQPAPVAFPRYYGPNAPPQGIPVEPGLTIMSATGSTGGYVQYASGAKVPVPVDQPGTNALTATQIVGQPVPQGKQQEPVTIVEPTKGTATTYTQPEGPQPSAATAAASFQSGGGPMSLNAVSAAQAYMLQDLVSRGQAPPGTYSLPFLSGENVGQLMGNVSIAAAAGFGAKSYTFTGFKDTIALPPGFDQIVRSGVSSGEINPSFQPRQEDIVGLITRGPSAERGFRAEMFVVAPSAAAAESYFSSVSATRQAELARLNAPASSMIVGPSSPMPESTRQYLEREAFLSGKKPISETAFTSEFGLGASRWFAQIASPGLLKAGTGQGPLASAARGTILETPGYALDVAGSGITFLAGSFVSGWIDIQAQIFKQVSSTGKARQEVSFVSEIGLKDIGSSLIRPDISNPASALVTIGNYAAILYGGKGFVEGLRGKAVPEARAVEAARSTPLTITRGTPRLFTDEVTGLGRFEQTFTARGPKDVLTGEQVTGTAAIGFDLKAANIGDAFKPQEVTKFTGGVRETVSSQRSGYEMTFKPAAGATFSPSLTTSAETLASLYGRGTPIETFGRIGSETFRSEGVLKLEKTATGKDVYRAPTGRLFQEGLRTGEINAIVSTEGGYALRTVEPSGRFFGAEFTPTALPPFAEVSAERFTGRMFTESREVGGGKKISGGAFGFETKESFSFREFSPKKVSEFGLIKTNTALIEPSRLGTFKLELPLNQRIFRYGFGRTDEVAMSRSYALASERPSLLGGKPPKIGAQLLRASDFSRISNIAGNAGDFGAFFESRPRILDVRSTGRKGLEWMRPVKPSKAGAGGISYNVQDYDAANIDIAGQVSAQRTVTRARTGGFETVGETRAAELVRSRLVEDVFRTAQFERMTRITTVSGVRQAQAQRVQPILATQFRLSTLMTRSRAQNIMSSISIQPLAFRIKQSNLSLIDIRNLAITQQSSREMARVKTLDIRVSTKPFDFTPDLFSVSFIPIDLSRGFLPGNTAGKQGKGIRGLGRLTKYAPDLTSLVFNIRGRAPKIGSLGFSGFESRPII